MALLKRGLLTGLLCLCGLASTQAAERPDPVLEPVRAQLRLKHYAAAKQLLEPLAQRGHATAEWWLANLYRQGLGVETSTEQMATWLERAAQHGLPQAMYEWAAWLAERDPVPHAEVSQWLQRAAAAGHPLAKQAVQNQWLPERFSPEQLTDANARRAAFWLAAAHNQVEPLAAFKDNSLLSARDEFGRTALHYAARYGALDTSAWLLSTGAAAETSDSAGITPLMLAARHGHDAIVALLLQQPARAKAQDQQGNNALMYAIAAGQRTAIDLLIKHSDLQQRNTQNWSALEWAIQQADTTTANQLRSLGLNSTRSVVVHSSDPIVPIQHTGNGDLYRGWPDILIAATRSPELFDAVLQNQPSAIRGNEAAALLTAVQAEQTAVIDKLLARGIPDVSLLDETPLSWAVRHEKLALVQRLLTRGVAADTHGKREVAPLLSAASLTGNNALTLLDGLLKAGAKLETTDPLGRNALMISTLNKQAALVARLTQSGAATDAADRQGRTALMMAASNQCVTCLTTLIAAHANVDKRDSDGNSALMLAAANGDGAAVSALIAAGASVQANAAGNSALMLAAQRGDTDIIKKLLSAGIKIDAHNQHGDTALILAARHGQTNAVKALLASGADRSLRNNDRATARDVAERLAHKDLLTLLDQRG